MKKRKIVLAGLLTVSLAVPMPVGAAVKAGVHGEKLTCRLLSLFDLKNVLEATKIDHWQNCLCEAFGEVFSVYCVNLLQVKQSR